MVQLWTLGGTPDQDAPSSEEDWHAGRRPGMRPPSPPRWKQAVLRWSLRTPGLQRLLGRSIALLTLRDRRTDRLVTTAVSYVRDRDRVIVSTQVERQWWRNLSHHPDVAVRLAGARHHGRARVLRGLEALDGYLTYLRGQPRAARAVGVDLHQGEPDPRQAQQQLRATVVVAIDLLPLFTRLPLPVNDRG